MIFPFIGKIHGAERELMLNENKIRIFQLGLLVRRDI